MNRANGQVRDEDRPATEVEEPRLAPKRAVTEEVDGPAWDEADWPWPVEPVLHDA